MPRRLRDRTRVLFRRFGRHRRAAWSWPIGWLRPANWPMPRSSEDRTRQALYAAIGRAYDFSLAAAADARGIRRTGRRCRPDHAGPCADDAGGQTGVRREYDKTRLTEYASALGHAARIGLDRGALGVSAVCPRRPQGRGPGRTPAAPRGSGIAAAPVATPANGWRANCASSIPAARRFPAEGTEFTLLVARRLASGEVVLLGEVADDAALLERAARSCSPDLELNLHQESAAVPNRGRWRFPLGGLKLAIQHASSRFTAPALGWAMPRSISRACSRSPRAPRWPSSQQWRNRSCAMPKPRPASGHGRTN